MATIKHLVTIKGNRDGLNFHLDDSCTYDELVLELEQKMKFSYAQILQGPLTHVNLYFGTRYVTSEQKEEIKEIIQRFGNLLVKEVHCDVISIVEAENLIDSLAVEVAVGTVRSGQVLERDRDLLILGDVNPGGSVISVGDIFILGSLRGMAHAGKSGGRDRIIAASVMEPTQLRIADRIKSIPEEWNNEHKLMQFAFLNGDHIDIDPIQNLNRIRPEVKYINMLGK